MSFQVFQAQGLRIFTGDTDTVSSYVGNAGEIAINTETKSVRVLDGVNAGGTPLTNVDAEELLGLNLAQLADLALTQPNEGDTLVFKDGSWTNDRLVDATAAVDEMSKMVDVELTDLQTGNILAYNAALGKWVNQTTASADHNHDSRYQIKGNYLTDTSNLSEINNVQITMPEDGQGLVYDAGKWINTTVSGGSDIHEATTASGITHSRIGVSSVSRHNLRNASPSQFPNNSVSFAFTTWNWNNSSPYADSMVMSTWGDGSGGHVNCLNISKSSNAMKVSRMGINSTSSFSSGSIYSISTVSGSDARVKENIENLDETLPLINQLRPVTFEWTDEYIDGGFSRNKDENNYDKNGDRIKPSSKTINIGLIAQEVEKVIPTVVHEDNISLPNHEEYLKDVDYEKIVPYLIKAVQELSDKNEELQQRISTLEGT